MLSESGLSDISYPDPQLKTLIFAASANLSLGTEGSFSQPSHTFDIYDQGGITEQPLGNIIIIIIILMFTTKPTLPTDRSGTFFSPPTCSSRDILSERRGFCAIWQLWYLGTGGFCQLSFLFQNPVWSLSRKDSNEGPGQKKSIKNYQLSKNPKIWMPVDSKIQKASVKYSNDKSFGAPHSRVNICSSWNPLISKRQISARYL